MIFLSENGSEEISLFDQKGRNQMQWFLCDQKFAFAQTSRKRRSKGQQNYKTKLRKKAEPEEEVFTFCVCPNKKLLYNQLTSR